MRRSSRSVFSIFSRRGQRFFSTLYQNGPDQVLPADSFQAWSPNSAVKLRLQDTGLQSSPPISVPTLFKTQVENLPNNLALRKKDINGKFLDWTWTQYHQDVISVAKAFISLGLEPLHTVAILGHNDNAWHMSNLAAIHSGGFATGIYESNSPTACKYIAEDSRANIVVVGDTVQLEKILSIKDQLPELKAIVLYEGTSSMPGVISWQELLNIGRDNTEEVLDQRMRNVAVNQCCILCYTSGTTGNPKGTMLSHDNITYSAMVDAQYFGWEYGKESVMSYLPQSHIAGMMVDQFIIMAVGGACVFADKNALKGTLVDNLKIYKPSRLAGVPRVFEKVEEAMKKQGATTKGLKKLLVDWAKSQAIHHHKMEENGRPHNSIGYQLARKLVFSKVHDALGLTNTARNGIIIGGAAVPHETVRYFLSLDLKLLEMISMTEASCCVQMGNRINPGEFMVGRAGKATQEQLEIDLINKNEIGAGEMVSRGRAMCMGYINKQQQTLDSFDNEGWFHSGDLCTVDEGGFYTVVGRIKEIIITAGGENVAPTNIEAEIKKALPDVVSNVMVVGDKQKYLTALITLKVQVDPKTLKPTDVLDPVTVAWVRSISGEEVTTVAMLVRSSGWEKIQKMIDRGIEEANEVAVSNVAKVKKWKLIEKEFSVDGGEIGPSLKLKRFYVAKKYQSEIEQMYEDAYPTIVHTDCPQRSPSPRIML